jgi:hypothetical protein
MDLQNLRTVRSEGFWVAWLTSSGKDRHDLLKAAANESFEEAMPCRRFSFYKGQRHFPGHYWFETTGQHVGYESLLERDHLTLLDFDLNVAAVAAQPFMLLWPEGRRLARHIPDFFVRYADGAVSVVDVKPKAAMSDQDCSVFSVMNEACAQVGWRHQVWHEPAPRLMRNIQWLAGFRRVFCHDLKIAEVLLAACSSPTPLGEVVATHSVAEQARPVLYHLMWRQQVTCDLNDRLSDSSLVVASEAA